MIGEFQGSETSFYAWIIPLVRAKVEAWGASEEISEIMGKLDPHGEEWTPDVEWRAFKTLQRDRLVSEEVYKARHGRSLAEMELEEIELTCSVESMMDEWAAILAGLNGIEREARMEFIRRAWTEAEEMRNVPRLQALGTAVIERLATLEGEL